MRTPFRDIPLNNVIDGVILPEMDLLSAGPLFPFQPDALEADLFPIVALRKICCFVIFNRRAAPLDDADTAVGP